MVVEKRNPGVHLTGALQSYIVGNMTLIHIIKTKDLMAETVAKELLRRVKAVKGRRFMIALSGGNTPKLLYQKLVQIPEARQILSQRAEFFFSDERPVAADHPDSNYLAAETGLFRPLGIDHNHVHRMRGEADDIGQEAAIYEQEMRSVLPQLDGVSRFDMTFLGLGADGHTASLFPDFAFDPPSDRFIIAPYVTAKKSFRLSFSLPLINASHAVFFLVAGSDKAEAVRRALNPGESGESVPAGRVAAKETRWFVERAAAAHIDPKDARVAKWPIS